VLDEITNFTLKGETLYAASGDMFKYIGVLRAADIFWNDAKKYVYF
jgi:hypothetical protein